MLILKYVWGDCLLEGPLTAKSQLPGRGNQGFSLNVLVHGGILYAIDLNKSPWTTGSKTAPKHQCSTAIFDSRYDKLFLVCIPLFDTKHADCVHSQKVPFWAHLTIAPCSSHSSNDVWQTPDLYVFFCIHYLTCVGQEPSLF